MTELRWSNYYLQLDFEGFWRKRLAEKNSSVCIILGVGFDPRSLIALRQLAKCGGDKQISCVALNLRPPSEISDTYRKLENLTDKNKSLLGEIENIDVLAQHEISLRDSEGHLVGGRAATKKIHESVAQLVAFRDVLIDISGLPRAIFYPLIAYLCRLADNGQIKNLHVAVTEDSNLDGKIQGGEYGNPDYIDHFRPKTDGKLFWLPVISVSEENRLQKIYTQIESKCAEICPILPFPAKNLRRTDEILMKMRSLLFEQMLVSRNNLLLCDERTPFDIYRKIVQVDDYYRQTLTVLPGLKDVTTVVSPLASKMLSLGMLLAAIERGLSVTYAEAGSYQIYVDPKDFETTSPDVAPIEIWLTGEPYL